MPIDPTIRDHQTWLGYLQPDGLVVSPAALVDSQVLLNRNTAPLQQRVMEVVIEAEHGGETLWAIPDFKEFLFEFLGWPKDCLLGQNGTNPIPEGLKVPLREFGETLEPTFAFCDPRQPEDAKDYTLLLQELPMATDLDAPMESAVAGWAASPTRRFERLLRETQVPIGLMTNATHLRLVYAPRGENTGTLTFPISAMTEVAGRPILAAFEMLLSGYRLLSAPTESRLPALLKRSRDYQSRVSTALAGQVLDALYELLRGFQAANDRTKGMLLKDLLEREPNKIYEGMLTVLMRLVFLLYAEDRGLMPNSEIYVRHYAIHGLFERLRTDAEQHPDTMDQRYGAWAQMAALFRAIYSGCNHPQLRMTARMGHLFDPERFPFLEGRSGVDYRLPLISDGVVYRVLEKLLILDGERLSYRTLDVEQIGSVYQTMMGFRLEMSTGISIALKPAKAHGAPVPIDLDALITTPSKDRPRWITNNTDYKPPASMVSAIKESGNIDDLLASLERRIARNATPQPVASGAMLLIPTDERRRSGSHYTPRILTEPIVAKTLEPILKQLGENPKPEAILNLKVCDPALGSGAFLVEVCRQLAEVLVQAWAFHGEKPQIPSDEDELLHARRLIAQRCLYGLDRNPMAVDLAKLSLWLVTLAKDHPFTFLDHALRTGDSLVGLTNEQITSFNWQISPQQSFLREMLEKRLKRASECRKEILAAGDDMLPGLKRQKLDLADEALNMLREAGDLVIAAFFSGSNAKQREEARNKAIADFESFDKKIDFQAHKNITKALSDLKQGEKPVLPFHWEIEFPEVFSGTNPGFDAIAGNPPFAGRTTAYEGNREGYLEWLKELHEGSHGNADLVAHFFRRAFSLIRRGGTFGLIATNTIGQGDTRSTGLRWICTHGGNIYAARKRYKWPGEAAVVVSVVHVTKGPLQGPFVLDGHQVPLITAYLFHEGGHEDPKRLKANDQKSFQGCVVVGRGFIFDDSGQDTLAWPLSEMDRLIKKNPRNAERIFPFISGEDVNTSPTHSHKRYVINFGDMSEEEAGRWPDLIDMVERRVRIEREALLKKSWSQAKQKRVKNWWQFSSTAKALYIAISDLDRVVAISAMSKYVAFTFVPTGVVYSHNLIVIASPLMNLFSVLQSHVHESWVQLQSSTLEDRQGYRPTDCFETFPFPENVGSDAALEGVGKVYYDFRADLMVRNNEGLTKTYNRFHNPDETSPDILRLRELHDAMDRTVLDAYGWTDIQPTCEFLLDYEEENEDEESGSARRRKKPWRYRWPDEVRDEVLARLLKLNAERAEEERRRGVTAKRGAKKKAGKRRKVKSDPNQINLIDIG